MKILVTGVTGQLGYDVVRLGLGWGYDIHGIGSQDVDLTNEASVLEYIVMYNPDAIIHCAAYTAVDRAEDDMENCWNINVNGTRYLATAAREVGAKFVYLSTDYVFNGQSNKSYSEMDIPNPVNYYGLTKYEGEQVVKQLLDNWFIIRISWVFGMNGNNFVKTMLRLAESRSEFNVVGDQFGSPTYTYDLAPLLLKMVHSDKYGIYHATNEGTCSWAEFAEEIFKQAGLPIQVRSISTNEYPTRAVRPKNSRMSKQRLRDNGFGTLPSWQDAVRRYMNELKIGVE